MAQPKNSSFFTVRRREPKLVTPEMPTPRECKLLSDIDDQQTFRFNFPAILFYHKNESMIRMKIDPVKVIRKALAKTLVFYYPFAGRLREGAGGKLMVDCSGEGVTFIEADADVTIEHFGDPVQPPFPCWQELLYDVPSSSGILDSPLILCQVTRLKCGGFILALHLNHTICDVVGIQLFLTALSEIALGAHAPSVLPVWQRELLNARDPLKVKYPHHEYEEMFTTKGKMTIPEVRDNGYFFFGPNDIRTLRRLLPFHLQKCSTFEVLTACIWKCRTHALQLKPEKIVRAVCLVNTRAKFNPPLSTGYYGNAIAFPVALTTARKLCENSIGYAVELIQKAKADVTEEYMRSVASLMVVKHRPHVNLFYGFLVSDVRRTEFVNVDFGWGRPAYAGPLPSLTSFYLPFKNKNGEDGIMVSIHLPNLIMERFGIQLNSMLKGNDQVGSNEILPYIKSAL